MNPAQFIEMPYWEIAGWTMLHFLWAGSLLAVAAAGGRFSLRRAAPQVRYGYAVGCFALLALMPALIAFWVTAEVQVPSRLTNESNVKVQFLEPADAVATLADAKLAEALTLFSDKATNSSDAHAGAPHANQGARLLVKAVALLPWLWIAGAPLMLVGTLAGILGTARLRHNSSIIVDGELAAQCDRLRQALGVGRQVSVAVCERVASPILVGIVKPLVLLPPAALCGWSTEQLKMVLLHELAHVRRWDNLVNLLQRLIESLLFFHPAVWVISAWVRAEREDCCDAVVVQQTGRADIYAETLAALAAVQVQGHVTAAAMARNHLKSRIRRLLNVEDRTMRISIGKLGLLFVAASVMALVVVRARESGNPDSSGEVGGEAEIQAGDGSGDLPFVDESRFAQLSDDAVNQRAPNNEPPFDALLGELSKANAVLDFFAAESDDDSEIDQLRRQRDEYQKSLHQTESELARLKTVLDQLQRQMSAKSKTSDALADDQLQHMRSDELRMLNEQIKVMLKSGKNADSNEVRGLLDRATELDAILRVHEDSVKNKQETTNESNDATRKESKDHSAEWNFGVQTQMPIGMRALENEHRHLELQQQRLKQQEQELRAQQAEIQKRRLELELMAQQKQNELQKYRAQIGFLNRNRPPTSESHHNQSTSAGDAKTFEFYVGTDGRSDRATTRNDEIGRLKAVLATLNEAGNEAGSDEEGALRKAREWIDRRIRQLEKGTKTPTRTYSAPPADDSSHRAKTEGRALSNWPLLLDAPKIAQQKPPSAEENHKIPLQSSQSADESSVRDANLRALEFLKRADDESSPNRALEFLKRANQPHPNDESVPRAVPKREPDRIDRLERELRGLKESIKQLREALTSQAAVVPYRAPVAATATFPTAPAREPFQSEVVPVEPIPGRWPARPQPAPHRSAPPTQTTVPTVVPQQRQGSPPGQRSSAQPPTNVLPSVSADRPAVADAPPALPTEQPNLAFPAAPPEQPALARPTQRAETPTLAKPAAPALPRVSPGQSALEAPQLPELSPPERPLRASPQQAPRPRAVPGESELTPDAAPRPSAPSRPRSTAAPEPAVAPTLQPRQPKPAAFGAAKEKPNPRQLVKPNFVEPPKQRPEPTRAVGAAQAAESEEAQPAEKTEEPKSKGDTKREPRESTEAAAPADEPAEESPEPSGEPAEPSGDIPPEIEP